ncbi:TetR/AcrR family transcriptional regulator [Lipingzhangella sp. LS1_29]|uniref:TetR/AcrR family transcriptional regulator n=1 Tax=Lipingzhangella rawalii TaxID=2055835 RepID=A0ABU2HA33_9ACTN|nr:TetR/AcrR family transcriptional regulator [Lipingzhangella rawalii]MDS1272131.1 TetR/AcrR family transcriptional regulator [Lipingzhangella rawalii]
MQRTAGPSQRGTETRQALLRAAAQVFHTVGFSRAGITEVVSRAGASVGGLYHHFTGKADLFLTLHEEFQHRQQDRTHRAVFQARQEGETNPTRLMNLAARAYLEGCIVERDTAWLFFSGDSPPGFDASMRTRLREWTSRNAALFRKADEPVDEGLLMVVSGAMMLAVTEVVHREDRTEARRLADNVMAVLARLEGDGHGQTPTKQG